MAKTKTDHKTTFLTNPLFVGIVVVVIVAVIIFIFVCQSGGDVETIENNRQPDGLSQTENQTTQSSGATKPNVVQYEGEDPNTLSELTGEISRLSLDGDILTVAVMIHQYLQEDGTCTMTATNQKTGQTFTTTSVAEPEVSTSACGLLRIEKIASGSYDLEIKIKAGDKEGIIKKEGVEI